jgi:hemerythrin-like metal-binding protein
MDLNWTPEYAVGVDKFDEHHQKLFAIIRDLYDSFVGEDNEKLAKVGKELHEYNIFHFGSEGATLSEHDYPGAAAHIKEHETFKEFVVDFCGTIDATDANAMSDKMGFVVNWLIVHIGESDKAYGTYFKSHGISIEE